MCLRLFMLSTKYDIELFASTLMHLYNSCRGTFANSVFSLLIYVFVKGKRYIKTAVVLMKLQSYLHRTQILTNVSRYKTPLLYFLLYLSQTFIAVFHCQKT
jgi:hypothetical protein